MAWIEQQNCDMLRGWANRASMPLLASSADGKIHWCNAAFESLIGYSEFELTSGQGGKGISWQQLSVDDESLLADTKMVDELLAGRREQYTVRKQYRPKNEKPIWVELHVLRYPFTGTVECFLVVVNPLKNGSQLAAQIASEQMAAVIEKLEELKAHSKIVAAETAIEIKAQLAPKNEVEQMAGLMARLIVKHPKSMAFIALVILCLFIGAQLVQAVNSAKQILSPTVQAQQP